MLQLKEIVTSYSISWQIFGLKWVKSWRPFLIIVELRPRAFPVIGIVSHIYVSNNSEGAFWGIRLFHRGWCPGKRRKIICGAPLRDTVPSHNEAYPRSLLLWSMRLSQKATWWTEAHGCGGGACFAGLGGAAAYPRRLGGGLKGQMVYSTTGRPSGRGPSLTR